MDTNTKGKVALIIVFNHKYDKNILLLEELYKSRFSNIFFLVPFYNGQKPNVIPVYESSYYFQGYIAQGFRAFFREEFIHYFFIGDDLILNPSINENNYKNYFELSDTSSYVPEVFSVDNITNNQTLYVTPRRSFLDKIIGKRNKSYKKFIWDRTRDAVEYNIRKQGVEIQSELPSYEEAEELLKRHGLQISPLRYVDVYGDFPAPVNFKKIRKGIRYLIQQKILKKVFHIKYPVVASYSDIVIVSSASIDTFVRYCGVFAASELFVEYAIPTALLFSSDKVVTEPAISKRGVVYWLPSKKDKANYENEMREYGFSIRNLMERFPAEKLYLHPVKLSKWSK